jgi:hypothetical protein
MYLMYFGIPKEISLQFYYVSQTGITEVDD